MNEPAHIKKEMFPSGDMHEMQQDSFVWFLTTEFSKEESVQDWVNNMLSHIGKDNGLLRSVIMEQQGKKLKTMQRAMHSIITSLGKNEDPNTEDWEFLADIVTNNVKLFPRLTKTNKGTKGGSYKYYTEMHKSSCAWEASIVMSFFSYLEKLQVEDIIEDLQFRMDSCQYCGQYFQVGDGRQYCESACRVKAYRAKRKKRK